MVYLNWVRIVNDKHFPAVILLFSHSVCPTLCDPMNCSMLGLPVQHQLPEFTQIHVHGVGDAIQPSHPLSPPSPPLFSLSQHQGLFKWVSSSHQMATVFGASALASVLPMNIQDWFPLGLTGWIFLQSKGFSRVVSNTTVQTYKFFSTQLSLQFSSHIHTWLLQKNIALTRWTFVSKLMSLLFHIPSRFFITFLPRSKYVLIPCSNMQILFYHHVVSRVIEENFDDKLILYCTILFNIFYLYLELKNWKITWIFFFINLSLNLENL